MLRRDFLELLATMPLLAACASTPAAAPARAAAAGAAPSRAALAPGVQLYTVRAPLGRDPDATLAALAAIGYREVETAGTAGRTARDFRALLDRHGLAAPSGHVGLAELRGRRERVFDDAATLGHRWLVCPWVEEAERDLAGWRRVARDLNTVGAAARARGLRLAYHNHDFEFARIRGDRDGRTAFDLLAAECDPALVAFELDVFWAVAAGRDPLALLAQHGARIAMLHLKDRTAAGRMTELGAGVIDYGAVLERARAGGLQHAFVEHDEPDDPIASVRASHAALRGLLDRGDR